MPLRSRRSGLLFAVPLLLALLLARVPLALSSSPPVLINEFMPRTAGGPEWTELFNPNPFDVDLSGWKIKRLA
jgi:hypothetical protein